MTKPALKREVTLSELQLAVVRVLWERGAATTAEVQSALAPERNLAHTTVATLLTRLEKRGVVASRRDGRQLIYRSLVTESEVRRSMVSELVASLFQGDTQALMTHLVQESEIRPGDIERMRKLLDEGDQHD
jgi:BlaI family transcriptional regulator, penicillinase repressor